MTTLADLRALVKVNIGGRDDADALLVTDAAINYAVLLAALVFEPPELRKDEYVVVPGGGECFVFSSFPNLLDIFSIYNTTDDIPMWYIPHELLQILLPKTIGATKYYSIFGTTVFVREIPSTNKTLKVYYSVYPKKLIDPTDTLEFDHHDSYIVSAASAIVMAALEEAESAQMWQTVAEALSVPLMLGARARQIIAGQKLTLEGIIGKVREEEK